MSAPPPIAWSTALAFWLRLGLISFGGPAGQIALMHDELVVRRRWISEQRFLHVLNFCMVLPGPEALQVAIYLGWLFHRRRGGIAAGVLFILPSFLLLMALSWIYLEFGRVSWVAALFHGIQPAVTAIVIQACLRIGGRVLHNAALWTVAVAAFLALALADLPFPLVIGLAALCGALGMRWRPEWFGARGGGHRATARDPAAAAALIDDHTPPPAHARPGWSALIATLAGGLLLWLLPLLGLFHRLGTDHALSRMAWFFSKAALLTFGGAYAVLPYVFQGAVSGEGWLTPAQMIDGLALGETTPGPLIIVVAFVGFVGAWQQALTGAAALPAGIAGASVACWFTFLPSFVMVLAGGPWIEATRRTLRFTGPLTAISAAVSGVIVHLALYFAAHVFWPQGWRGPADLPALAIAALALWLLLRWRRSVIEVIALCAAIGGLTGLLPRLTGGL